jgi:drug/metabolite transporter (DMT)-like permease
VILLGESLHALELAGGVLIFAGIVYERLARSRATVMQGPE